MRQGRSRGWQGRSRGRQGRSRGPQPRPEGRPKGRSRGPQGRFWGRQGRTRGRKGGPESGKGGPEGRPGDNGGGGTLCLYLSFPPGDKAPRRWLSRAGHCGCLGEVCVGGSGGPDPFTCVQPADSPGTLRDPLPHLWPGQDSTPSSRED